MNCVLILVFTLGVALSSDAPVGYENSHPEQGYAPQGQAGYNAHAGVPSVLGYADSYANGPHVPPPLQRRQQTLNKQHNTYRSGLGSQFKGNVDDFHRQYRLYSHSSNKHFNAESDQLADQYKSHSLTGKRRFGLYSDNLSGKFKALKEKARHRYDAYSRQLANQHASQESESDLLRRKLADRIQSQSDGHREHLRSQYLGHRKTFGVSHSKSSDALFRQQQYQKSDLSNQFGRHGDRLEYLLAANLGPLNIKTPGYTDHDDGYKK